MTSIDEPRRTTHDGYRGASPGDDYVHEGVICATREDLVADALSRVRHGVVAHRTTLAILRPEIETEVRRRLGSSADAVHFLSHGEVYEGTARALHEAFRTRLYDLCDRLGAVTVVAQHDPGTDEGEDDPHGSRCIEAEVLATIDFTGLPVHHHCLFPADRNTHLIGIAYCTHPMISDARGTRENARYRSPAVLAAAHPALTHLDRLATVRDVWPDVDSSLRTWLGDEAVQRGLGGERAADFALAAHEALRTAARCAAGPGTSLASVRLYLHRTDGHLACDVDAVKLPLLSTNRLPTDPSLTFLWFAARNSAGVDVQVHRLDDDHSRIRVRAARQGLA